MNLFDFSNPAERARTLMIRSAKLTIIGVIFIFTLLGIISVIVLSSTSLVLSLIIGVCIVLLGLGIAVCVRDSTFYKLAILEACEEINKSKKD